MVAILANDGVGATVGGPIGASLGLGFPEYEAKRYKLL